MNKKIISFIFLILILIGFFSWKKFFKKEESQRYLLSKVERGMILLSVSGSGQISAKEQIDIKSKISGEIEKIYVEKEEKVKKGDLLLKLKTKDYESAINEAQIAIDNAQMTLENFKKSKENSQKDLNNSYEDVEKNISNLFYDLPQTIETLETIFTKSSYGGDQADIDYYRQIIGAYNNQSFPKKEYEEKFLKLKEIYQEIHNTYFSLLKPMSPEVREEWLSKAINLIQEISNLAREGRDVISYYKETISKENLTPPISLSLTENQLTNLSSIISLLDQKYLTFYSLSKTIDQLKDTILDYSDKISSQEKTLKQKKDILEKAKENYENCFIRANFSGRIAKVYPKEGDLVSSNTLLLNLITDEKIVEISLNEIDAAKVKEGQKSILTFDAIPDLTLTGKVIEVDSVGTISQGVVSYGVKIGLDSDDERIKPSMSATVEIIVDAKTDILVLPTSAIKTQGGLKYVELVEGPEEIKKQLKIGTQIVLPKSIKTENKIVETGISNDTQTEILSGLKEGEIVISSRISSQVKTSQNRTTSSQFRFQIPGIGVNPPR